MSADNGIYILKTKDGYRVKHLQAIENIFWWPTCCDNPELVEQPLDPNDMCYHDYCANCETLDPDWERREEINPAVIYDFFSDSRVFETEEDALNEADFLYISITRDDFCGIVEYGIQMINGLEDQPFPTQGTKKETHEND
jgi:hypothetical protein